MTKLLWEFAPTGGGDEVGLNDPLTTTFRGKPASLARESIQNILDARDDKDLPVRAEFSLLTLPVEKIPGWKDLKERIEACRDYIPEDEKRVAFYDNAAKILSQGDEINILKISDFNTSGLLSRNYYNFFKGVGTSMKSEGSGGSFGIGKGAYWEASQIRTIFVFSIPKNEKPIFQGKARLAAHKFKKVICQNNGSFGVEGQNPINDVSAVSKEFGLRKENGTDIYILALEHVADWAHSMRESVLNNFWLAIANGTLNVRVDGQLIDESNLDDWMHKIYKITEEDSEERPNPLPYYQEFKHHQGQPTHEKNINTLGSVKFYASLREEYAHIKSVIYFRKTGMRIKKTTHQSSRIAGFAGVFICDNDEGNDFLRLMENQNHDEWNWRNVKTEMQERAQKADKDLTAFVRECLKTLIVEPDSGPQLMPDLERFLQIPHDDEILPKGEGANSDESTNSEKAATEIPILKKAFDMVPNREDRSQNMLRDEKVELGPTGEPSPKGNGSGQQSKTPESPAGSLNDEMENRKLIQNMKLRNKAGRNASGQMVHFITASGEPNCKFCLVLKAGTDDDFDAVEILEAYSNDGNLKIRAGSILGIMTNEKGMAKISVRFDNNARYALKLTPYED